MESIRFMDDCGSNGIIKNDKLRSELSSSIEFVDRYYKFSAKTKRLDPVLLVQEMESLNYTPVLYESMRKAIKLYGYNSRKIKSKA